MGWHTTMQITKGDALQALMTKLLNSNSTMLESMLDAAFYDAGYNFTIIDSYEDLDPGEISYDTSYLKRGGAL